MQIFFFFAFGGGKEALGLLILGGKEKKIFYSLFSFLFSLPFLAGFCKSGKVV
jgi:hypothetical protein